VAMRRTRRGLLIWGVVLIAALLAAAAIIALSNSVRWRMQVVVLKARGNIPELSWPEFVSMLRQRDGLGLDKLLTGSTVHGAVRNPYTSDGDVSTGAVLFQSQCARCHGPKGEGAAGPALAGRPFRHGDGDWSIFRAATRGIPGTPMVGTDLADADAWRVVAYVRSLQGWWKPQAADPFAHVQFEAVTPERLAAAPDDAGWLTYSGTYKSQRYSHLDQINRTNVSRLRLKWLYDLDSGNEPVEATPIVVGAVMYVTVPPNKVVALEASTGRQIWTHTHALPKRLSISDFRANRGVAVFADKVYFGTLDAQLVALNAKTGEVAWSARLGNPDDGHSITGAPLAVHGKILIGISGGEFGIRGFLDAYDAATGRRVWRFYTIPEPGQPGSDTWQGESWRTGGGSTWISGSYDVEANLVYWGIGNPAPDFNGDVRPGDNLYTCGVVALDANTGALRWHFQFTPHDVHDWDSIQVPVLADLVIDGRERKVLLSANKNGFYYVLDRRTGEFLRGRPFVKVTWAKGLTATGRPVINEDLLPSEKGALVWPNVSGGTNWLSPSFSPRTRLFYVPALEQAGIYFSGGETTWKRGRLFLGGASQRASTPQTYVRALKAESGELAWEYSFGSAADVTRTSGVLSTAGDVVFAGGAGPNGLFVALDAQSGRELWRSQLGGLIHMGPMSFQSGGNQIVAVAAGQNLFAFEAVSADEGAERRSAPR